MMSKVRGGWGGVKGWSVSLLQCTRDNLPVQYTIIYVMLRYTTSQLPSHSQLWLSYSLTLLLSLSLSHSNGFHGTSLKCRGSGVVVVAGD